jgi:maltose/moltooligosaccharide transporter
MASLGFGWLMRNVLNNDRLAALTLGAVFMLLAAAITVFMIKDKKN